MHVILIFISSAAFIFYGLLCLLTSHMRAEFERYGLSRYRKLTGFFELCGGTGLLFGHSLDYSLLIILSSGGLATLMLFGVIVRIKTRDPIVQAIPAFLLMLLNLKILVDTLKMVQTY